MVLKYMALFFALLFLVPTVNAQQFFMDIEGECIDYNITLMVNDIPYDCYDVKIDAIVPDKRVGEIYDPIEGWKSSYYYIKDGYCVGKENNYMFRAHTSEDLNFIAKIKVGSETLTSDYFTVEQNCPGLTEMSYLFLAMVLSVLFLVAGLTLYVKKFK